MVVKSLHRSVDLVNSISKKITSNDLIRKKDRVLLSISGGQDSICLLLLLNQLCAQMELHLALLWCNHLWQFDSFLLMRQIVKLSFLFQFNGCFAIAPNFVPSELLARHWRHNCNYRICFFYNYSKMSLAHSANDKVETIFLNLMRGTGLTGLFPLQWTQFLPKREVQKKEHVGFATQFSVFLLSPFFWSSLYNGEKKNMWRFRKRETNLAKHWTKNINNALLNRERAENWELKKTEGTKNISLSNPRSNFSLVSSFLLVANLQSFSFIYPVFAFNSLKRSWSASHAPFLRSNRVRFAHPRIPCFLTFGTNATVAKSCKGMPFISILGDSFSAAQVPLLLFFAFLPFPLLLPCEAMVPKVCFARKHTSAFFFRSSASSLGEGKEPQLRRQRNPRFGSEVKKAKVRNQNSVPLACFFFISEEDTSAYPASFFYGRSNGMQSSYPSIPQERMEASERMAALLRWAFILSTFSDEERKEGGKAGEALQKNNWLLKRIVFKKYTKQFKNTNKIFQEFAKGTAKNWFYCVSYTFLKACSA